MTEYELAGWHKRADKHPYVDIFIDVNDDLFEEPPEGPEWEALYRPRKT